MNIDVQVKNFSKKTVFFVEQKMMAAWDVYGDKRKTHG